MTSIVCPATCVNVELQLKSVEKLLSHYGCEGLSDVQVAILVGTWAGESYGAMADRSTYAIEYLREVGSGLWKLLTEVLGEPVTKKNVRLVLQRYQQSLAAEELEQQYFWGEAIDVSIFYGRTVELRKLQRWVTQDRCRLIEVLAIGGMGKTALAVKLAQQVAGEFEFVVWRSLRNAPPFVDLCGEIIALLSRQQEVGLADPATMITRLLHYLRQHRCLLVLDNVESILQGGYPYEYLAGYERYGELLRQVGECSHQSCVLLTSREQVAEVANFAGAGLPVRVLSLGGLSIAESVAILDDKGLAVVAEQAQGLVDLYGGNPLALKIISTSILELFDGKVAAFLDQGTAVFNGIRMLLARQFDRLSGVEQQVMFWLAINREWVSLADLQGDLLSGVSVAQILEALEYLQGRSLIETKAGRFTLQPVVMEYAIEKLLLAVRQEVCSGSPGLLLRYALMKAQAKDYVRESQIRVIVQPLLAMLGSDLGGEGAIVQALQQLLVVIGADGGAATSYGAGNCLNMLCQLQADLTGLNLAGLSIRQADLREVSLPLVDLTGADLNTSLFAESTNEIYKVVISPDNRLIANGTGDGTISVWQIDTSQKIFSGQERSGIILGLAFTSDSKKLIVSSLDKHIEIWDVESGLRLQSWSSIAPIYNIALNNDDRVLACAGTDGSVLLWDIATCKILSEFIGHTKQVIDVAFHPQGKLLASSSADATIKLWDIATGKCIQSFVGHTQLVATISFNAAGTQLISSGFDALVKIWSLQTGQCIGTLQGHSKSVSESFFDPNGQFIISGSQDRTIRVWTLAAGEWECSKILQSHQNIIWSIALNSTGTTLVSSDHDGALKFWDVASWQCIRTLHSTPKIIRTIAFHPQTNLLVSGGEDRKIRLWDFVAEKCIDAISAHNGAIWKVLFDPKQDFLASCGMDGQVKLWELIDNIDLNRNPKLLQQSANFIVVIAIHPSLTLLASGASDSNIYLWNYSTGELLKTFHAEECGMILDLAFHPTRNLLVCASHDPNVRIWDIDIGYCCQILQGHTHNNWAVAIHPQGELVATAGQDETIRLWDIDMGMSRDVLTGHTSNITKICFSPNGAYLASASMDRTIRIWEVATGECVRILKDHTESVNFVVYHPDEQRRLLASCSHDETIRLWDTDTWECVKILRPQRIYEGMKIAGAKGITAAQLATLQGLGAIAL
jgi:WD40 repeat protein